MFSPLSLSSARLVAIAAVAIVAAPRAMSQDAARQSNPGPIVNQSACPHDLDAAKCPFCDPTRIDRLGMCREHGVPEALCVACRPYLKAAFIRMNDWCDEHYTPESQCLLCNPSLEREMARRSTAAGAELRWQRDPAVNCVTSSTPVTLSSTEALAAAGFQYVQVSPQPLARIVERNAQLAYDANRYARLSSRAGGVVVEVRKDLGEPVAEGEVIAIVESMELSATKAELLQSVEMMQLWQANVDRERSLLERGIGIERELLEATTRLAESRIAVNKARQSLRSLGLSAEQIQTVERETDTSPQLFISASFEGTVIERLAVMGEVVDSGQPIVVIADTETMWAMVDLAETDLASVRIGQRATVLLDGLRGGVFPGELTWISTAVDPSTRTLRARIELPNPDGLLRSNMFGRARINAGESRSALVIPKEAVQWEGCCNVAFAQSPTDPLTFKPSRLVLGFDAGDRYEVLEGLTPGELIVNRGSFILKNEILKNSVGAGCCEVDHLRK